MVYIRLYYITTLPMEVKKALLVSIPALLITGVAAVWGVHQSVTAYSAVPLPEIVLVSPAAPPEPPEAVSPVQVVNVSPEPVQSVVEAPSVPTNEELADRYGFSQSAMKYIIDMFPKYFTESERLRAFEYLNSVVQSNKVVGTEPKTINSIEFVKWYFMNHYEHASWVNVGILAEVDTSGYDPRW